MKKNYLIIAAIFAVNAANSQIIFSEDFDLGMPATWTLADVDGNTPDANVAQFTSAWIVAEDFDNLGVGDSVAMSTSWYAPAGTSDDWMMTPSMVLTTNNILTWDEEGQDANFPDGYEVYITTAIAGANPVPADFTGANGTMIFSVAASSAAAWLTQTVDLQAQGFSNQTIWIAWRNNATDQFILMINNVSVQVQVPFDVSMTSATNEEYTLTPLTQVVNNIGTDGIIANIGGSAVTNAVMTVNVYDGTMTSVYTATSTPVANIAGGANNTVSVPGYLPTVADVYTVEMISSITEADSDASNDTATYVYVVTDSVYARDNGQVSGALGIGAGNGGELGQLYVMPAPDDLTSISAWVNASGMVGSRFSGVVYDVVNGVPTTVLALTDTIILPAVDSLYTLTFPCGSINITSDSIAVLVHEHDSTLALATTTSIFTLETTYINWPTIPTFAFDHNEAFGFNVSYVVRPNFGTPVIVTINNAVTSLADSITAVENGVGVTYQWIDCNNGNAMIPGATAQTYTATVDGDYAVIVSNACVTDTSVCTNILITSIDNQSSISDNVTVAPNPSNGVFTLSFNGITSTNTIIEVLDVTGKVVMTKLLNNLSNSLPMDMTQYNAGTYFIKISSKDFNSTQRFIILK